MNPFEDMLSDTVFVVKASGQRLGPYKTAIGPDNAQIFDARLDVEIGDGLVRPLPNGREENYTIVDFHFSSGFEDIPPCYELVLRKAGSLAHAAVVPKSTTINIHNSSGVQVGDHNVINIQNAINELIAKIELSNADDVQKTEAKSRLAAFLNHPLVTAILGGVAGSLPGLAG